MTGRSRAGPRRERRASSGGDLLTARGARGWHRQTLSVQQPQRLGHQIAAISPGAATDSGDLPGADGLSLMGVLGVSEGAQYDALLRGHAATLVGRSDAVAPAPRRGRRSRLQRRKRPENPNSGSAQSSTPSGPARQRMSGKGHSRRCQGRGPTPDALPPSREAVAQTLRGRAGALARVGSEKPHVVCLEPPAQCAVGDPSRCSGDHSRRGAGDPR